MDAAELHRLVRVLTSIVQRATWDATDPEMTQGEIAVLRDVLAHPNSPVSAITARTGFAQSHISASVARLRDKGHVEVRLDPQDARSTQVHVADVLSRAVIERASRSIDGVLREALSELSDQQLAEVDRLLQRLADLVRAGQPQVTPKSSSAAR